MKKDQLLWDNQIRDQIIDFSILFALKLVLEFIFNKKGRDNFAYNFVSHFFRKQINIVPHVPPV